MRRGAAAQADATAALAPDPGGANIYPATVAKQGRRWREASSQKAFEAPPHPSQKRAQSEPRSFPTEKASYIPPCTRTLGSPLPTLPQPGNRPEAWTRGNVISGLPGLPPLQSSSLGDSNLTKCPLPTLLLRGGWNGEWSKESGDSEERDAEGWRQEVQGMETGREDEEAGRRAKGRPQEAVPGAGGGLLMGPEKRGPQRHSLLWPLGRGGGGTKDGRVLNRSQMWPM